MIWYASNVLFTAVLYFAASAGQAAPANKPITAEFVRQQLADTGQITWRQKPLRDGLSALASSWNIPIFLDRRVDPDQLIDFRGSQSREGLLRALAEQLQLEICILDTVVYIGPPATASVIASIAERRFDQANQWGKQLGKQLRKRGALAWQEAAEPRAIVEKLAADRKLQIEGLEQIPFDLWPAHQWQSLPVTHQLTLLLAGFGYTYELSDERDVINIIPLPESFSLERKYQLTGNARQRLERLKDKYSQASFSVKGKVLTVVASAEDHYWIRRGLLGAGSFAPPPDRDKRYQLNISASFDEVARAIANNLGLQLVYDPSADDIKDQRIELSVKNVTEQQLLEALVKTVSAKYTIQGGELRISR